MTDNEEIINEPAPQEEGANDPAAINIEDEVKKPKNAHAKAAANAYAESKKIAEEGLSSPEIDTGTVEEAKVAVEVEVEPTETAPSEPDYKTLALKTAAEFENFRKRITREKAQWKREALADFLKEFLPAFDDLDRAISEGEKNDSYEIIHDGAKLVRENMWKSLSKAGVVEIDAQGKPFNPVYHEAMTMIPMPGAEPNSVVEVFQSGYMINDFVLRPAKVVVAADQ